MFINMLKLYRIGTACKIIPRFYNKSKKIAREYNLNTFSIYIDMIMSLIKFGASEENYEQYHFWEHDDKYRDSFITWRRNLSIMHKFCTPESKELFLDKVVWNKRFAKYVKRDWLYCKTASLDDIENFLKKHESIIIKKIDGACGVGVKKYNTKKILADNDQLSKLKGENIILEEIAVNAECLRQFSPSSLNTLRFVTCIDHSGIPHIIATVFRMGNGKSLTDNFLTGGIACYIDPETGVVITVGINAEGKVFESHPFSHKTFKGFQIPQWEEAKKLVLTLAMEVPEARFVGWDVVLTEKGFDILEGNIPPAEELTELDMKGKYRKVLAMY